MVRVFVVLLTLLGGGGIPRESSADAPAAADASEVITPWPDALAEYDMKSACYVTTVYADDSTIEQCFANLNNPESSFRNDVCTLFGLTSAPEDQLHARSRSVDRCPSGFDGACIQGYPVGQSSPHITFYYNMNTGPQNQTAMVRSQCERAARTLPIVPGKWIE